MSAQPLEIHMAHLEGAYEQLDKRLGDLSATIDARFAQVDARFAQVDARFAQVDARFAQVDARFDGVDRKIDGLQWRMTSLIVGTWITTILAIILRH
jgi:hypothetical protein